MKKKEIIKALQKQLRVTANDFDERIQKLEKENESLFAQNQIYQSEIKHYSQKLKELSIQNVALLKDKSELLGIIEIMKHQLYDKVPEVKTITSVDYDPDIQMFENKVTTSGAFEEVKL